MNLLVLLYYLVERNRFNALFLSSDTRSTADAMTMDAPFELIHESLEAAFQSLKKYFNHQRFTCAPTNLMS